MPPPCSSRGIGGTTPRVLLGMFPLPCTQTHPGTKMVSVLGTLHHERHEVREPQDTEGENMPPRQHSRPSFISSCEAVKARGPAETALDHPGPWQPHED